MAGSARTSARILVVDDEIAIRRVIARYFAKVGYETIEAADGSAALAELEARGWKVDLVLTDVEMPEMNGLELARRIRLRNPLLPILYMSGYVEGTTRTDPGARGMTDDTLTKPFDFTELVARVRDALQARGAD